MCHDTIKKLLADYRQKTSSVSFTLSCFSSAGDLLDHIDKNTAFDIYILDVIMPDFNGIQLGKALREQDDSGLIIYLTSSADFAVESYNTDALHYLLKPVSNSQFFQCMDKAISRLSRSPEETISIKTPGSTRIAAIHNILYAERVNRHIRYYLSDNTVIDSITFNDTFQNAIAPLVSFPGFLIVGSSFVVNLQYVTEVTKSDLLLTGNHLVPIPRRSYETVKTAWADYWLKKGDTHAI
ncbi:MAG: LytTR family DNA-binding domain-containing protein [bacterium]|nr:LytTR family DNA-binding domain-containing protein [bacterium]MCM1376342.1 LytTR family DNA-binding domain-containing protein [Muribaculum sp.]